MSYVIAYFILLTLSLMFVRGAHLASNSKIDDASDDAEQMDWLRSLKS